jgi:hypothetical protein
LRCLVNESLHALIELRYVGREIPKDAVDDAPKSPRAAKRTGDAKEKEDKLRRDLDIDLGEEDSIEAQQKRRGEPPEQ